MQKNVAGQKIGAQMVSATDGSAFTGSVTVYVTGDAGTQAAGSVGSGACAHEGNGYHTYAPAQAETNYDLVAFTFIGTGAVPSTVQVFTGVPQTGDAYARLGAPAGASVSADVAAVKAQTAAIETDTQDLQTQVGTDGAGLTAIGDTRLANLDATVSSRSTLAAGAEMDLVDAPNATAITAIQAGLATPTNITAGTITTVTNLTNLPAAAATAAELAKVPKSDGSVSWNATALAAINAEVDTALNTAIPGSPTADSINERIVAIDAYGTPPTAAAIRSEMDSNSTKLANLDAAVSSRLATAGYTAPLDAAGTRTAVGLATANLDTQLAALPTDADVQTAATAALNAYDPPTKAELDSAVAPLATASALSTVAGYVDTEVAAIKAVTDKVDTALEADGATGYQFTALALENAPTGGSAPSAADIRAEIDSNSTQLAAILADTNELQTDWANGGRLDLILDARASQTSVDDLPTNSELATALAGADDAVLSAIAALPTDADVQTAAAAALTAYDPPTNAEMEARTLAAASYATASALDTVDNFIDTEVAAIKAVTDKLDTALELDGAVYRYTTNALEQAPTGGGTAPTVEEIRAEIDANSTQLAAIVADTNELQTDLVNGGRLDLLIDAIKAKTDNLPTDPADQSAVEAAITSATSGLSTLNAAGVRSAVGLASANLDTQLGDLPTNSELVTALAAADDATLAAIAALPTDADVQTAAAAALTAYDPPTKAELDSGLAALNDLDAAGVRAAVGLAAANLDTQLADLPTNSELTTALGDIEVTAVVEAQTIADAMAMATDVVPEDNSPLAYLEDILEDTGTTLQAALAGAGATVTIVSAVDGGDIEVFSGDTWEFTISSSALSLSKYEALGLVVKRTQSQTDNEALLYLRTGASGLQRINGAAPISTANGTLTNTATSFTGKVAMLETDGVTPRTNYAWWLKGFDTTPDPDEGFTLATGKFTITPAGLQAIA